MVRFPLRLGKRGKRITLLLTLIAIIITGSILAFYQLQQEQLVSFLTQYGAYNPKDKYTPVTVVHVDSLPRPSGNFTQGNVVISYAFHSSDNIDNVPYLWITYLSPPPCVTSGTQSQVACHQMLLIIASNNVTAPDPQHALYAQPHSSFGFELVTASGQHIEWELYLFLVTYSETSTAE
ncbi:MAG TPA: hypothetical protein VLV31_04135 [Candidatus Acidoferrales bacterium]|nr:hypothetical protein [Candidatus Acidoferrales bacterium]